MSDSKPKTVLRSAYRVPEYLIDSVDLAFDLAEDGTRVEGRLGIRRRADSRDESAPLVLAGESLELLEIEIDGRSLAKSEYRIEEDRLVIESLSKMQSRFLQAANFTSFILTVKRTTFQSCRHWL